MSGFLKTSQAIKKQTKTAD